ncbi:biotin-dependent carboxyltransferase family protein [Knoellia aerolata]|uniref:Allophanate hydrolase n=1 Tax=Knoellia aerolata DSM 18566 TaxID=1385519 RepID=A0A0A0K133_9MICO|nr:biotin-dependent carboxyltransferase family protein [Knoellia aerolata]KGN41486.1 allophanate hydrolase [Knoellia aerolata DSM 18566]
MIEVVLAGALTTVQDLGRPGHAHLGVGRSGAVDRPSLRLANRLVGNPEDAPALELTFGGLTLRAHDSVTVALTGAPARLTLEGRPGAMHAAITVAAGETLEIGMPSRGVRTYLAVRGGLVCDRALGSASTDVLSGLGPPPVTDGVRFAVGRPTAPVPGVDVVPGRSWPVEPVLRLLRGPRDDWFAPEALELLGSARFEATPSSDRVGVRLDGPPLTRVREGELPSEGMVEGAVQVPPDGHPVVFLADHPVTGGYPVVAVVHPDDVPVAAQLRPGDGVRFRFVPGPVSPPLG